MGIYQKDVIDNLKDLPLATNKNKIEIVVDYNPKKHKKYSFVHIATNK